MREGLIVALGGQAALSVDQADLCLLGLKVCNNTMPVLDVTRLKSSAVGRKVTGLPLFSLANFSSFSFRVIAKVWRTVRDLKLAVVRKA